MQACLIYSFLKWKTQEKTAWSVFHKCGRDAPVHGLNSCFEIPRVQELPTFDMPSAKYLHHHHAGTEDTHSAGLTASVHPLDTAAILIPSYFFYKVLIQSQG